jgi:membrane protease YdiL (CAAX protease family)
LGQGFFIGIILAIIGSFVFTNQFPQTEIAKYSSALGVLFIFIEVMGKAVAEELIYRLLLINYLRQIKIKDYLTIFLSGILFGLIHIPRYQNNIGAILFSVLFGWILGWLVIKRKSIWLACVTHITTNLVLIFI